MRYAVGFAFVSMLALAGCNGRAGPPASTPGALPGNWIEARAIKPPQQDVRIGSLYYAREKPTADFGSPVAIEPLCFTTLDLHGVQQLEPVGVTSFDVTDGFSGSGGFSGIKTMLVSAGLRGDLTTYYDLKLANVTKTGITHGDAQTVFDRLRRREDCQRWFGNVDPLFAVYQVESVYTGDIVLSRKHEWGAGGELALTLEALQPKLEAKLRNETRDSVTGKTMVFAIVPLPRNLRTQ